jgi:hypothetical protein
MELTAAGFLALWMLRLYLAGMIIPLALRIARCR